MIAKLHGMRGVMGVLRIGEDSRWLVKAGFPQLQKDG
jgi:hypothetical protein